MPINKKVSLKELKEHIFTLPEYPKSIPYRTSYYEENWGFCITHEEFDKLIDDEYEVVISSALENGHLRPYQHDESNLLLKHQLNHFRLYDVAIFGT